MYQNLNLSKEDIKNILGNVVESLMSNPEILAAAQEDLCDLEEGMVLPFYIMDPNGLPGLQKNMKQVSPRARENVTPEYDYQLMLEKDKELARAIQTIKELTATINTYMEERQMLNQAILNAENCNEHLKQELILKQKENDSLRYENEKLKREMNNALEYIQIMRANKSIQRDVSEEKSTAETKHAEVSSNLSTELNQVIEDAEKTNKLFKDNQQVLSVQKEASESVEIKDISNFSSLLGVLKKKENIGLEVDTKTQVVEVLISGEIDKSQYLMVIEDLPPHVVSLIRTSTGLQQIKALMVRKR